MLKIRDEQFHEKKKKKLMKLSKHEGNVHKNDMIFFFIIRLLLSLKKNLFVRKLVVIMSCR